MPRPAWMANGPFRSMVKLPWLEFAKAGDRVNGLATKVTAVSPSSSHPDRITTHPVPANNFDRGRPRSWGDFATTPPGLKMKFASRALRLAVVRHLLGTTPIQFSINHCARDAIEGSMSRYSRIAESASDKSTNWRGAVPRSM